MTTTLSADKKFDWNLPITEKTAAIFRAFGLTVQRLKDNTARHFCRLNLSDGNICYITGPSGSGKSVLLKEFYNCIADNEKIDVNQIPLPTDKTCADCFQQDFLDTLETLSKAGITDVFCVLNAPANLSDGQKYRYRLAKAIASNKKFVFADEFASNLDRITAAVISYNLRKLAVMSGKIFILASSHDDLLADLLPDVIIIKHLSGEADVIYKNPNPKY